MVLQLFSGLTGEATLSVLFLPPFGIGVNSQRKIFLLFYSILSHNLGRSSGHHR